MSSENGNPKLTVVIPSYNQADYLACAIDSVLIQDLSVELIVMDADSVDESVDIIKRYSDEIFHWQSIKDNGQAVAINSGVSLGSAQYVCWLNSDDYYLPNGLRKLLLSIDSTGAPMVYGRCLNTDSRGKNINKYLTFNYNRHLFANYCFICQPATIVRRDVWDAVGGLNESLDMAMDYDLWWRIINKFGEPFYLKEFVAANSVHPKRKTTNRVNQHYIESMQLIKQHYGRILKVVPNETAN